MEHAKPQPQNAPREISPFLGIGEERRKRKAEAARIESLKAVDLDPMIGVERLSSYDDFRAYLDSEYAPDAVQQREAEARYTVEDRLPIPANASEDKKNSLLTERDAMFNILTADEASYQAMTEPLRPSDEAIAYAAEAAARERIVSGQERAEDSFEAEDLRALRERVEVAAKLGGLVGRLAEDGFEAEDLRALAADYDAILSQQVKPGSEEYIAAAMEATDKMLERFREAGLLDADEAGIDRSLKEDDSFKDIYKFLRYNDKVRTEVETSVDHLNDLWDEEDAAAAAHASEQKKPGIFSRLNDRLNNTNEKSDGLLRGMAADVRSTAQATIEAVKGSRTQRAGETDEEYEDRKQTNRQRTLGAASINGANRDPNIFRRVRDRILVDTGIAMSRLWNRNEQRGDETNAEYEERMRKVGKFSTATVMAGVAIYAASRIVPGISEMFQGNSGGNTVTAANDVLNTKNTAASAAPTPEATSAILPSPKPTNVETSPIKPEIITPNTPNSPTIDQQTLDNIADKAFGEGESKSDKSTTDTTTTTTTTTKEATESLSQKNLDKYSTPSDWALEKYGRNYMDDLHRLSDKAQAAGHDVEWHGSGRKQWLEIGGKSDAKSVLGVLSQFAK